MTDGYVYFAERGGVIKIGWSREPAARCLALGAHLLAVERGSRFEEGSLHRRFRLYARNSEWFDPAPEVVTYIKTLPSYRKLNGMNIIDASPFDALRVIQQECWQTAEDKDWHLKEGDATVGDRIALMHSELSEALEAFRVTGDPTKEWVREADGKPEGVPSELADTIIRILDFCGIYGIDLAGIMERKMAFNKSRPSRHGGKHL